MENFELYIEAPPKSICRKGTFKKNGIRKYLNSFEVKEIIKVYPDRFNWELARNFNVSESAILNIRRKYNLKKSQTIIDKNRFPKGHKPFNKGKRHLFFSNSGQFSKGHIPKNHRELFSIRLQKDKSKKEGYLYLKIAEPNKWMPLHRYVWQQNYGGIPYGKIIIFQDGNVFNTNVSNLQMISRMENMERNRNRKKAAESMRFRWHNEKLRTIYGLPRKTKLRISA